MVCVSFERCHVFKARFSLLLIALIEHSLFQTVVFPFVLHIMSCCKKWGKYEILLYRVV